MLRLGHTQAYLDAVKLRVYTQQRQCSLFGFTALLTA